MGYDFTGGRIFDFPIDFSMGLTTVQRATALPVIGGFPPNILTHFLKLPQKPHFGRFFNANLL